jgi:hypothetical protein
VRGRHHVVGTHSRTGRRSSKCHVSEISRRTISQRHPFAHKAGAYGGGTLFFLSFLRLNSTQSKATRIIPPTTPPTIPPIAPPLSPDVDDVEDAAADAIVAAVVDLEAEAELELETTAELAEEDTGAAEDDCAAEEAGAEDEAAEDEATDEAADDDAADEAARLLDAGAAAELAFELAAAGALAVEAATDETGVAGFGPACDAILGLVSSEYKSMLLRNVDLDVEDSDYQIDLCGLKVPRKVMFLGIDCGCGCPVFRYYSCSKPVEENSSRLRVGLGSECDYLKDWVTTKVSRWMYNR